MKASKKVLYSEVLNTSDLNCVDKVSNLFKKINISFKPIKYIKKHNTNEENNFLKTSINSEDLKLLEQFILKLIKKQTELKKYLRSLITKFKVRYDNFNINNIINPIT